MAITAESVRKTRRHLSTEAGAVRGTRSADTQAKETSKVFIIIQLKEKAFGRSDI